MIDALVAASVRRRRAAAAAHPERQRKLSRPVVSIGNLSVGGSGKTPLVAYVARALLADGHVPAVLSRGYARPRPSEGAVVVSDGTRVMAGYDDAGDEPLMLARQLPGCAVIVAADRYLAGALAERRLGCTVHVLDDGFQHLQLARTVDLVVVTARDLDDRVMPLGRLREPLDTVRAADAVVVEPDERLERTMSEAGAPRLFRMLRLLSPGDGEPVFAFAGIGHPAGFFDALERAGWVVAGRRAFADHYRYSSSDLARIEAAAIAAGARALATTEKDAARLDGLTTRLPLRAVPLEIGVEPADGFRTWLTARLESKP